MASIVDYTFATRQHVKKILDPFVEFCDAVEAPLDYLAKFVIDNKAEVDDFVERNRQILAQAGGSISFWVYINGAW